MARLLSGAVVEPAKSEPIRPGVLGTRQQAPVPVHIAGERPNLQAMLERAGNDDPIGLSVAATTSTVVTGRVMPMARLRWRSRRRAWRR
jgi:hypothetical protein